MGCASFIFIHPRGCCSFLESSTWPLGEFQLDFHMSSVRLQQFPNVNSSFFLLLNYYSGPNSAAQALIHCFGSTTLFLSKARYLITSFLFFPNLLINLRPRRDRVKRVLKSGAGDLETSGRCVNPRTRVIPFFRWTPSRLGLGLDSVSIICLALPFPEKRSHMQTITSLQVGPIMDSVLPSTPVVHLIFLKMSRMCQLWHA